MRDPVLDLPVALMDDAALTELGLARVEAGELPLPDGRVVTTDPLVFLDREPLARSVPAGSYPVSLVVTPSQHRVALGVMRFSERDVARWEMAVPDGVDPGEVPEGQIYGFGVDAGTAAFASSDWGGRVLAVEGRYADLPHGYWDAPERERVFGMEYDEPIADRPEPDDPVGAIVFASGWGDGFYASYWGLDDAEEPVALVIDFGVLEDGQGLSEFERDKRQRRVEMGEAAWRASGEADVALIEGNRDRFAELLASSRVSAHSYSPLTGEPLIASAIRENADWALDLMIEGGANDTFPDWFETVEGAGTPSAFARWLHALALDPKEPLYGLPRLEPRSDALLRATGRLMARGDGR